MLGGTGSPSRTRTYDPMINSHLLYRLSYRGIRLKHRYQSDKKIGIFSGGSLGERFNYRGSTKEHSKLAATYFPTQLPVQYHRPWLSSLLNSRWYQVFPNRYRHQKKSLCGIFNNKHY